MGTTGYKGIDYGMGQTNRDESGTRYGVISQNEILQAWADESEPEYPECEDHGDDCPDDCDFFEYAEPIAFVLDRDGYKASCGDSGDVFVLESPFVTYAQFCSPCAPGACYLMNPIEDQDPNNRAYCFGHDWFDGGEAPYPVFDAKTGERVEPKA